MALKLCLFRIEWGHDPAPMPVTFGDPADPGWMGAPETISILVIDIIRLLARNPVLRPHKEEKSPSERPFQNETDFPVARVSSDSKGSIIMRGLRDPEWLAPALVHNRGISSQPRPVLTRAEKRNKPVHKYRITTMHGLLFMRPSKAY